MALAAYQLQQAISLRRGSFFEKSGKLQTELANLLYYWSIELPVQEATKKLQVDENTMIS